MSLVVTMNLAMIRIALVSKMQISVPSTVSGETEVEIFLGDAVAKEDNVHYRAVHVMQQAESVIRIYALVEQVPTLQGNQRPIRDVEMII